MGIPRADLEAAGVRGDNWSGSDVRFAVRRDAGALEFTGSFSGGQGTGTFGFFPNAAFAASLKQSGRTAGPEDMLRLAIHDVSRTFIEGLEARGYRNLDIDELVRMRIHGVDPQYVDGMQQAGYAKLSADELVRTRIHGATPAYVQELRNVGYTGLSIEDLVKTRIHGATPSFIQEVK